MFDVLAVCYLVAVFICLPAIGSAYTTRHIDGEDLVCIGIGCALALLEVFL